MLLNARETDGMGREFVGLSAEIMEFLKNKDGANPKDETWNRLTEMTGFSLVGFGFFKTRLGMGTYNRERNATILRKFNSGKEALRGSVLRVPIGNRIAHAAAALTWGTSHPDKPDEDTATLADCIPQPYESYEPLPPDGKKSETRGKAPQTADMFARAAKQHVELFGLVLGANAPGAIRSDPNLPTIARRATGCFSSPFHTPLLGRP